MPLLEYKKFITIDNMFFNGSKKREKIKLFMWLAAGPGTVKDLDTCGDRKTVGFEFWNFLFRSFFGGFLFGVILYFHSGNG